MDFLPEQCFIMEYTELQITSNFSFLRGASHPEELIIEAAKLGYRSIAITDRNTLAGIVRAHAAAQKYPIRLIPACRLDLLDGPSILVYPVTLTGYAQLSNLLTFGNRRTEKGKCELYSRDVHAYIKESKVIVVPPDTLNTYFDFENDFKEAVHRYKEAFGDHLYIGSSRYYAGDDFKYLHRLQQLASTLGAPMVATNDVHYHNPARRELQDIICCIREKCTIHNAGYHLHFNAERYLKPIKEMMRLYRQYPDAIERTQEIETACQFSLNELKYRYPREITTDGRSPQEELTQLAWEGAKQMYGEIIPEKIAYNIGYELAFMESMNYAEYFLTVYDIVRFARKNKILCQGRGSAANSTVCYCLGITAVDPTKFDLLFERFISSARNEPPDIDVDFEHERREEVMQYIFQKYGRDRAAVVATVTQLHHKGAIRDVGKAMGLSVDTITRISSSVWDFTDAMQDPDQLREMGVNPKDKYLAKVLQLTKDFVGFPRQLGQHTGGFVITDGKLSDLCPILNARMENRTCIEWNKDDIDTLGFLKIDVLALGMLTCIRKAFDLGAKHYQKDWTLANIPQDDPVVYEMISHGDTIGVFQIESRAQQSMLPRLRPKCFYDLVIEVAIVRPGPIQGDMVHPYLRRRNGEEAVEYPSPELEAILHRTLGVPLFQEQAMKIAIVAAGFTPAEADELRRSMATFKAKGMVAHFEEKLVRGMTAKGYTKEYAQRVFKQLEGFGSYGFPESHAASFALLVYVSAWIKCYFPDIFACALLNSMPMGFYQPSQIIIDAQKHGVTVEPVDINYSTWDNQLEQKAGQFYTIRLGFRQVKGIAEADIALILSKRNSGFTTLDQIRDLGTSEAVMIKLADADVFRSVGLDRREALWVVTIKDRPKGVFAGQSSDDGSQINLPVMRLSEHVIQDFASTSLSLKAHPVSFIREKLNQLHVISTKDLVLYKNGDDVRVAGLVLVRQRPGTAKGVCFMTIEDETSFANLVIFQNLFQQYQKEILQSKLIMVEGKLQIEGEVIHVIVQRCHNFSRLLQTLTSSSYKNIPVLTLAFPDETSVPSNPDRRPPAKSSTEENVIPGARNFK